MFGWGPTEGNTVDTLSQFGSYIHASDFANNLATLSAFQVQCLQQQAATASQLRGSAGVLHEIGSLPCIDIERWLCHLLQPRPLPRPASTPLHFS